MIRFAAGAKVCAASESRSPFSLSMSPLFKQKNRFDVRIIQQTTLYTAANLLSMIVTGSYKLSFNKFLLLTTFHQNTHVMLQHGDQIQYL